MTLELIIVVTVFILAVALLTLASSRAVEHSVSIASALEASPLMVGRIVPLETSLLEITNAIGSSAVGLVDINLVGALRSALTQRTLILGLLPLFGERLK